MTEGDSIVLTPHNSGSTEEQIARAMQVGFAADTWIGVTCILAGGVR